jgi:hypothetical protein
LAGQQNVQAIIKYFYETYYSNQPRSKGNGAINSMFENTILLPNDFSIPKVILFTQNPVKLAEIDGFNTLGTTIMLTSLPMTATSKK